MCREIFLREMRKKYIIMVHLALTEKYKEIFNNLEITYS